MGREPGATAEEKEVFGICRGEFRVAVDIITPVNVCLYRR